MTFEGIIGTILTGALATIGYFHKRTNNKIDVLDSRLDHQELELMSKMDRVSTKEIVNDRLAPIEVTLQDIRKDIHEIQRDIKKLTDR